MFRVRVDQPGTLHQFDMLQNNHPTFYLQSITSVLIECKQFVVFILNVAFSFPDLYFKKLDKSRNFSGDMKLCF